MPISNDRKSTRREFLRTSMVAGATLAATYVTSGCTPPPSSPVAARTNTVKPLPGFSGVRPNIVLINADDLGYGDLGCYGGRAIKTPHLDALAAQGVRFTDFYACDSVCSPSRAGLLTGRYPKRMGLDVPLQPGNLSFGQRVMLKFGYLVGHLGVMDLATSHAVEGLPADEITLAAALKIAGYRTGLVGKWHLGDFMSDPAHNPTEHGFDEFIGVPHSNDMHPFALYRGKQQLEAHIEDQGKLTGLYTREIIEFITRYKDGPFFAYLAHTFPHRPLHASAEFRDRSAGGDYGDAVEEIDDSVGQIVRALEEQGLSENTIIIMTSDNGPWYQGSPGVLRGRKGQSFEGGNRVPMIVRWPGQQAVPGRVCHEAAMNIDLFPTLLAAAGLAQPTDRMIDGRDIRALITTPDAKTPHDYLYYYHHGAMEGVRQGNWKYFRELNHYVWPLPVNKKFGNLSEHTTGDLPLLFNLALDPGEAYNVQRQNAPVAAALEAAMQRFESGLKVNPRGWL